MRTLADFKKDLHRPDFRIELITRNGEQPKETQKGLRSVAKIQSNGVWFLNSDGKQSWLDYPKASTMEYDGAMLKCWLVNNIGAKCCELVYKIHFVGGAI